MAAAAQTARRRLQRTGGDHFVLLPELVTPLLLIMFLWTGIVSTLQREHGDALREAVQTSGNLARAFEENTRRIVGSIDQTLQALRTSYQTAGADFDLADWEHRQDRTDRFTAQLGIVDQDGQIVATSLTKPLAPFSIRDRAHFRAQMRSTADELFISQPVLGRGTGRWTVQFTRKLMHPDGSFAGIVVLSLDCVDLSRFYQSLELGDGFVLLAGTDGVVRARGPVDLIGQDLNGGPLMRQVGRESAGWLRIPPGKQGPGRIISYRALSTYPLLVAVGLGDQQVFAHYRRSRGSDLTLGAVTTAVVLLLGGLWIAQRRRSLQARRALGVTLETISQGIAMVEADGRLCVFNHRAADLLGVPYSTRALSAEQLRLMPPGGALCPATRGEPGDGVPDLAESELPDGSVIEIRSHALSGGRRVYTYTDITGHRRSEAQISHLALHDALTGLPNRLLMHRELAVAMAGEAAAQHGFAIFCLDLDGFKEVNDTFGHDIGDRLLQAFADRLRRTLTPRDLVARTGGDEFAIVHRHAATQEEAQSLAVRIIEGIASPLRVGTRQMRVGTSIGVAIYPRDGADPGTLLKSADIALYCAKADGRGTFRMFEPALEQELRERRALQQDLRQAVERGELEVYFQPQFCATSLEIAGLEALARWHHPTRGQVPPDIFIAVAEECGLVETLGRQILRRACHLAAAWPRALRVAVNLSPVQFRNPQLPEIVDEILDQSGLAPGLLELEVTEGVLIRDEAQAMATLAAFSARGIRVALDDFGTGYSSLSYLRRFHFDKLKIDKSFVQTLEHDEGARAILEAIVTMARRLDLPVTAEGVETEAQLTILRALRCTELQGFHLGRPVHASEVAALIERPRLPMRESAAT